MFMAYFCSRGLQGNAMHCGIRSHHKHALCGSGNQGKEARPGFAGKADQGGTGATQDPVEFAVWCLNGFRFKTEPRRDRIDPLIQYFRRLDAPGW